MSGELLSSVTAGAPRAALVSVVMNFLNCERFIEEAIESVYAQSYTPWELLLVDDGSTDGSTEIARRYAANDPARVRYLEFPAHENRGVSAARNLGISAAQGEFLAFLDADDVWREDRLKSSVELFERYPEAGMVYGKSEYWHSWVGDSPSQPDRIQSHWIDGDRVVAAPELLIAHLTHQAALPCMSAITLRRRAALAAGGFVESFRGMHEDQVFLARVCRAHGVYVSNECWDRYRQHEGGLCAVSEKHGEVAQARAVYLAWLRSFLEAEGMRGTRVWSALRYAERVHRLERSGVPARLGRLLLRVLTHIPAMNGGNGRGTSRP